MLADEIDQAGTEVHGRRGEARSRWETGRELSAEAGRLWASAVARGAPQPVERTPVPHTFSIEVLGGPTGESFLVHFGRPDQPRLVLIDGGGDPQAWKTLLRPRLQELCEQRGGGVLHLDAVVASQWDMDRIGGLIGLGEELLGRARPWLTVGAIYFNVPQPLQERPKWKLAHAAMRRRIPINPGLAGGHVVRAVRR